MRCWRSTNWIGLRPECPELRERKGELVVKLLNWSLTCWEEVSLLHESYLLKGRRTKQKEGVERERSERYGTKAYGIKRMLEHHRKRVCGHSLIGVMAKYGVCLLDTI